MPWKEMSPMHQRYDMVRQYLEGSYSVSELSERYGVSRGKVYKWVRRFKEHGYQGLQDRSRAPRNSPNRMPEMLREALLAEKRRFPRMGPKKIRRRLLRSRPDISWPAASTMHDLFAAEGLVTPRRRHGHHRVHPGRPVVNAEAPNDVFTVDYKGQFRTQDHVYCYPLTVVDLHSRFILDIRAHRSTSTQPAHQAFVRLFKEYGLPKVILSDNGVPFCSVAARQGLSKLNVFWMKLGIAHLRTEPSSPQQNGAHERMHRTLKAETTRPPAANLKGQQRKFDNFRRIFNHERPHEALEHETPSDRYQPSNRPFPKKIPGPEYPSHFRVRKVGGGGAFRMDNAQIHIAGPLIGEYIGLEEVDEGVWDVYFYNTILARYDAAKRALEN